MGPLWIVKNAKNVSTYLDHWFYESDCPSCAIFQISNFEEDEIVSMFYACGLHVLCIVSMLFIHPHIVKHDVGGGNHGYYFRCNVHLMEIFLHSNKINFIHSTTNFYVTSAPKTFLRILTGDSMHPIGHHVPWFKFQILKKDEIIYMLLCSLSGIDIRDTQSKEVSAHADFPKWSKTY